MPAPRLLLATSLCLSMVVSPGYAQESQSHEAGSTSVLAEGNGAGPLLLGAAVLGLGFVTAVSGGGDDGGGGGGENALPPPSSRPAPIPVPVPPVPRERFQTEEFARSPGLAAINVDARYADGGTGRGVLSAIFDSGAAQHYDLVNQIDWDNSYSYYTHDSNVDDPGAHGTAVAALILGEKNDRGMHGVAFDSRGVIFQGVDGPGDRQTPVTAAWADATQRAIALGARSMNHSWSFISEQTQKTRTIDSFSSRAELEGYFGPYVLDALDAAVAADMVSVFSAGNDGLANPSNHGGMAVFLPEYANHTLVAVALDSSGRIASFSNRCGMARAFCLAAPGTQLVSAAGTDGLTVASGTSMAAPHVTGAINVLASNFPELTSPEIVEILKNTARDLGAPGVDNVYGHGALDLETAVAPKGRLSVQTGDVLGARMHAADKSHIIGDGAITAALRSALTARPMMLTDGYDRGYHASMDAFVYNTHGTEDIARSLEDFVLGRRKAGRLTTDGLDLAFSTTPDGVSPTLGYAPFARLIAPSTSMALTVPGAGLSWTLAGAAAPDTGDSLMRADLETEGPTGLRLAVGMMREQGGVLGAETSGAFGDGLASETRFFSLGGRLAMGKASVSADAGFGVSSFDGDGLLAGGENLRSRSLRISWSRPDTLTQGDRVQLSARQATALRSGRVDLAVPVDLPASDAGARTAGIMYDSASIDLKPQRVPVDVKFAWDRRLGPGRLGVATAWRPDTDSARGHALANIGFTARF